MRILRRRRHDGGVVEGRTLRRYRLRLSDEIRRVTERHASSWDETVGELTASGFGPRTAEALVRTNFVGVGWDVESLRVDLFGPAAGMLLVPRGIAARLSETAADLRAREETVLRHPAGSVAAEHRQAS